MRINRKRFYNMKFSPAILLQDMASFFPMLWAVLRGKYKMPWGTFCWSILCLIYVISPIDILPEFLPVLGITDDGAFVLLVLTLLHKDLENFRQDKKEQENVIEAEVISDKNN